MKEYVTLVYKIEQITDVCNGMIKYLDDEIERNINIRQSADNWWDFHHPQKSFRDFLLRKKQKNIYCGNKDYAIGEITFFTDNNIKIKFTLEVPSATNQEELTLYREKWDNVNIALNREGFWLFDMA